MNNIIDFQQKKQERLEQYFRKLIEAEVSKAYKRAKLSDNTKAINFVEHFEKRMG